jgi:hypothetical protein
VKVPVEPTVDDRSTIAFVCVCFGVVVIILFLFWDKTKWHFGKRFLFLASLRVSIRPKLNIWIKKATSCKNKRPAIQWEKTLEL